MAGAGRLVINYAMLIFLLSNVIIGCEGRRLQAAVDQAVPQVCDKCGGQEIEVNDKMVPSMATVKSEQPSGPGNSPGVGHSNVHG